MRENVLERMTNKEKKKAKKRLAIPFHSPSTLCICREIKLDTNIVNKSEMINDKNCSKNKMLLTRESPYQPLTRHHATLALLDVTPQIWIARMSAATINIIAHKQ